MSQLLTAGRAARLTLLATTTAALLLVPLVPAQALPASASAPDLRAAGVPSCVTTSLDDSGSVDHLTVRNGCGSTQRIKVVIAHGTDFACRTYRPGTAWRYQWAWPGRFDELRSC